MSVYSLDRPAGRGRPKIYVGTGTGPSADVTVTSGGANEITTSITLPSGLFNVSPTIIVGQIDGIPDGLCIARITASVSDNTVTVTIRLYNPTAADVTVSASAVTVTILAIG